jgi:hypothetical protein
MKVSELLLVLEGDINPVVILGNTSEVKDLLIKEYPELKNEILIAEDLNAVKFDKDFYQRFELSHRFGRFGVYGLRINDTKYYSDITITHINIINTDVLLIVGSIK